MMETAKTFTKSPPRSKSSTLVVLRLLGRRQKQIRRSQSMPLHLRSPAIGSEEQAEEPTRAHAPCHDKNCTSSAPPLNRWSSAPACVLSNACSLVPARARSMRNLSILPPRQPTRRSGKAEELLSALPPKCPLRKPGDAAMASHALPPFLPKRCIDQDLSPCSSNIGASNDTNLLNSFAFCNINNASFVSYLSDSESDSDLDDDDDYEASSSSSPPPPTVATIRANIRRVLGDVLEQLEDDDDFGYP